MPEHRRLLHNPHAANVLHDREERLVALVVDEHVHHHRGHERQDRPLRREGLEALVPVGEPADRAFEDVVAENDDQPPAAAAAGDDAQRLQAQASLALALRGRFRSIVACDFAAETVARARQTAGSRSLLCRTRQRRPGERKQSL